MVPKPRHALQRKCCAHDSVVSSPKMRSGAPQAQPSKRKVKGLHPGQLFLQTTVADCRQEVFARVSVAGSGNFLLAEGPDALAKDSSAMQPRREQICF